MENQEKQFVEGFNNGYLIAKHEPDLYNTLKTGFESKNDYLDGFLTGGREYEHEKHTPNKGHSRDIEIDRDR